MFTRTSSKSLRFTAAIAGTVLFSIGILAKQPSAAAATILQLGPTTNFGSSGPAINLTAVGTTDWIDAGVSGTGSGGVTLQQDATGTSFSGFSSPSGTYNSTYGQTFSWTNGTPNSTGSNASDVQILTNNSVSFNVAASSAEQTLFIYSSAYSGESVVSASLNGGTPITTNEISGASAYLISQYEINFADPSGGTLAVTLSAVAGPGYSYASYFAGAALQPTASTPEPATFGLAAIGAIGLLLVKRRRMA